MGEGGGRAARAHHIDDVTWLITFIACAGAFGQFASQSGTPNWPACGPTHETRVWTRGALYRCT